MPEQYNPGERLHVAVEGVVAATPPGEDPTPGELTITLDTPGGPYDVAVPLNTIAVTVERLIPAGGRPRPNEVWRDAAGTDRWAYLDSRSGEMCLIGPDGVRNDWRHFNIMYGPLTRIHPPAPAEETTPAGQAETGEPVLTLGDLWKDGDGDIWTVAEEHGQIGLRFGGDWGAWAWVNERYGPLTRFAPAPAEQAEQAETGEPRVMLGDLWEDGDGDIWKVVTNSVGEHRLTLGRGGILSAWTEVSSDCGPLRLVQRAGYRSTTDTVPAERLTIGMVVSCPEWVGGAPVRLTTPADGTERAWELFGDGEAGVGVAASGAVFTVWEPTGGAR